MDINKLLEGVECSCGKHHTCPIKYVYIEEGAISRLTDICRDYKNILLVADENTYAAAGKQTEAALSDKNIKKVMFGSEILVPNEAAINAVEASLSGNELIVGIGSGVIQDLCKYVSFYNKVPYMVVATAPSMDGYASNGAAMITGGMKVTYAAGLPLALVADTDVLAAAPIEMLKAGYGDIIGKFSALNDWKLAAEINNEYFCTYIYDLTFEQIERTLKLANGILRRDKESVKTLMEALIVIGILMSFAGSSRPASGSEHHLSHFFEITGILENTDYLPHGIDVAFSTVVTSAVRERLAAADLGFAVAYPEKEELHKKIGEVYGSIADSCIALQDKVGNYNERRALIYKQKEDGIKAILKECPGEKEILEMLSLVELDYNYFLGFYGKEKIKKAVLYAKDLKDRFTCLWLNYDIFGEENGK